MVEFCQLSLSILFVMKDHIFSKTIKIDDWKISQIMLHI